MSCRDRWTAGGQAGPHLAQQEGSLRWLVLQLGWPARGPHLHLGWTPPSLRHARHTGTQARSPIKGPSMAQASVMGRWEEGALWSKCPPFFMLDIKTNLRLSLVGLPEIL